MNELNLSLNKYFKNKYLIQKNNHIDFLSYMKLEMDRCNLSHLSAPLLVGLKITNHCNFSCPHCFSSKTNKKHLLLEDVKIILDKFGHKKPYSIYLTGGEPLLNPDFLKIVKYIKSKNIVLTIHTNGSLLNHSLIHELSKILSHTDCIQISLDGHTKELFEETRNIDFFDQIIASIQLLKTFNLKVKLNTVVTNKNVKNLIDIYKLAIYLNVDIISFSPLLELSNSNDCYLPSDDEILTNFINVLDYYFKYPNNLYISQDPIAVPWGNTYLNKYLSNTKLICPANRTSIEIDSFGNVFPCPFLHKSTFKIGNLINNTLSEIWNNENIIFRNLIWNNNSKCSKCSNQKNCTGGCFAAAYIKNTNYDPRCSKFK
ncbi:radical SAM/SPASM domain-containing protein [Clostridium sardiniense]|uniref:radical SAM/SPASM domain-containing protein n=1 Tax=Clostridium sardiniense TaxID=29369 RepID=UPI0019568455|nr:radical SAM protein [Clostridium sardiniense]MBM7836500.1 radical SAM protein with 4Fe4S-binding SPASM domain [Clostridium sardiniense]